MQMKHEKPTKLLMVETKDVIEIHERLIKETGGNSGVISYGNIDFVVNQANLAKEFFTQAARMLHGLITCHGFVDGNKRTAFVATESLLRGRDLKFFANEEEIWEIAHEIAEEKVKLPEIVSRLRKNVGELMKKKTFVEHAEDIIKEKKELLKRFAEEDKYLDF